MNKFQKYVEIEGIRYKINPDYRNLIEIDTIFKDKTLNEQEMMYKSLNKFYLFFHTYPVETHEKLAREMVQFYIGKQEGNGKGKKSLVPLFDYNKDWDMIYSAFYECYQIRLTGYMHWHEFKQLFDSLNSECKFSKVKSYRGYTGKDKEMKELKKYWALPINKADIERQNNIYEQLTKGE